MAIRKLLFEEGEKFELRSKTTRVPNDEILENMQHYLQTEERLIVKCGKSFWDVSAYPEIYEAGEEFHEEDLTPIDKRQMEKKEAPKPAFVEKLINDPADNPLSALYHKTEDEKEPEPEVLDRKTYFLRQKDIEALRILCYETNTEVSAMVREIFARGIPDIAAEIGYGDVYAEAEANLAKYNSTKKKKTFAKKAK